MNKFWLIILAIILLFGGFWLYNRTANKNKVSADVPSSSPTSANQNSNNQTLPFPTPTITKTISGDFEIPILMYHYIRVNPDENDKAGANLSVSPDEFRTQMKYLRDNGYEVANLNQMLADNGKKKVVLTFDDGYHDAYENAAGILKDFGFTGTVFVIVNKIGENGYLNWDEIKALKNAGWEIGSHTIHHLDLTNNKGAKEEITESKKILEEKLGTKIDSFCYPAGKYNDEIKQIITNAGYHYAVTTKNGYKNNTDNLLELKRTRISGSDGLSGFASKIP